tara:strand:+ start:94 stop:267 length:174 start_codon:yes stop_codon:yes gene_type:complete
MKISSQLINSIQNSWKKVLPNIQELSNEEAECLTKTLIQWKTYDMARESMLIEDKVK